MKKNHKFLIWFCYSVILVVAFELTDYFIEYNLLSPLYVAGIEIMFLGLGWFGAVLDFRLKKYTKNKNR